MPSTLEKRHAVIHTASIDVKIMRLEKKQVTMSVFRQLDELCIFSEGEPAKLLGVPWGRVNYVWKGCPDWATFHIVWQLGDELKRMPLPPRDDVTDDEWECFFGDIDRANLFSRAFDDDGDTTKNVEKYKDHIWSFLGYIEEFEALGQLFIAV